MRKRKYTQAYKDNANAGRRRRYAEAKAAGTLSPRPSRSRCPDKGVCWADTQPGNRGPEVVALTYEEIIEARRHDEQMVVCPHRELYV